MLNKIRKMFGMAPSKRGIKLVKYRDPESPDYTFFWVDKNDNQVSPNFENENEAIIWLTK